MSDDPRPSAPETSGTPARRGVAGPAAPTAEAHVAWRPIGPGDTSIRDGFWAERQRFNGADAITSGLAQLESFGNLTNMRIAAGQEEGDAIGPVFADSDVYKWLEAVAWEYHRAPTEELLRRQREVTAIVAAAQEDDGYLDSVVQVRLGRAGRYTDLPWSHEHYCAGHLIQAAVAQHRATGDTALLEVAVRLADHLVATFGAGLVEDIDGHPVIETALVELYRETGTTAYLDLAAWFVDARGRGIIAGHGKEPTYFSDRVPVREAESLEGHAVRAVYLAAGAADVAVERGDDELLEALARQFDDVIASKTYLTGGLGSRWEGESFGEPFELPPDRAYAETCAAIGGVQWAWRMLLATREEKYADAMERMLYNGFLAGVSLGGTEYFYVNPLQLRAHAHPEENRSPAHGRRGWFDCACCPPNIMRLLASLDGYLSSTDGDGVQLHHYTPADVVADAGGARVALRVDTDYPWDGRVAVTVEETGEDGWTLSLRIPSWASGAILEVAGESVAIEPGTYAELNRVWTAGDVVVLTLPVVPRETEADPRIDAIRGSVAVERGPLVYALEQADLDAAGAAAGDGGAIGVDDVLLPVGAAPRDGDRVAELGGVVSVRATGEAIARSAAPSWPYPREGAVAHPTTAGPVELTLVPYYAWANRALGAMRVWIPRH